MEELPIHRDGEGNPETHDTRIYRIWRWVDGGCMDAIFTGSVLGLHEDGRLDTAVIHGDGTTAAAKKGGDNLGFSGHKRVKGDKVVAFCDRRCNVIAPFVVAPGNRNEAPLRGRRCPKSCASSGRWAWISAAASSVLRRLRLPGQPQGDLQPRHGSQH